MNHKSSQNIYSNDYKASPVNQNRSFNSYIFENGLYIIKDWIIRRASLFEVSSIILPFAEAEGQH